MSQKYRDSLMQLVTDSGLKTDEQTGVVFGVKGGYSLYITQQNQSQFYISVSVSHGGDLPELRELKTMIRESRALTGCSVQRYKVVFTVRPGIFRQTKSFENLHVGLDDLVRLLGENGYHNCCQSCGKELPTDAYTICGNAALLCEDCFI